MKSGQKIVEEEDLKTGEKTKYRDEHSGPFSWKTRSQQVPNWNSLVWPEEVHYHLRSVSPMELYLKPLDSQDK